LVLVSKDNPELVAIAYDYFKRLGVTLRVFLDDESTEQTKAALESRGIPFALVRNPIQGSPEAGRERAAAACDTEWVLFIDNDELVNSRCLLEVSLRVLFDDEVGCYGIPRSWVLQREGRLYVGETDFIGDDYQYRLVKHREVRFHNELHTHGFDLPPRVEHLNAPSRFYHFDWAVRSEDDRRRKVDYYAELLPGTREAAIRYYLPEESKDDLRLAPMAEPAAKAAVPRYLQLAKAA
jgi:glycosyltransferase involved in cell wall biosynthesis